MKGRVGFNQAKTHRFFDLSISSLSGFFFCFQKKNPNRFDAALLRGEFQRNAAFRAVPFASSGSEVSFFGFVAFDS